MFMAIDLGYGAIKVFAPYGGGILPSHVAVDGREHVHRGWTERRSARPLEVRIDAGNFYVGDGAHDWGTPVENLDFDRFLGTPEMKALLYGAFTLFGCAEQALDLVVGMPLEFLTGPEDVIRGKVKQVKRWLRGEHVWDSEDATCHQVVASVAIASQADGTLFDYFLDSTGQMVPERLGQFKAEIGIMNVGMNTVDLLVVQEGRTRQRFTAGNTVGVRRLLELCNAQQLYTIGELDRMLRGGDLDTRAAMEVWAREVLGFIEHQWGKAFKRFGRVVCAGGGSILLRDELVRRFGGKVFVPDDPVMTVARGLFRYALMREARRESRRRR